MVVPLVFWVEMRREPTYSIAVLLCIHFILQQNLVINIELSLLICYNNPRVAENA